MITQRLAVRGVNDESVARRGTRFRRLDGRGLGFERRSSGSKHVFIVEKHYNRRFIWAVFQRGSYLIDFFSSSVILKRIFGAQCSEIEIRAFLA